MILTPKNNGSKYGHYNKGNQTIAWTIKVNENQRRLRDAYLIDQIPEEQTYVAGSLKVVGTPTILSKEEPNAKNNQTLKVSFPENSTSLYTITFVTKVQQEGKVIKEEYKNLAKLYDKKYKKPINLQGTVQPENGGKVINKTGKQNGTLMDWSVTLNQSQSHLINGKLKDELDANSLFIEKSFKLVDSKGQNVAIKPVIETKSNNGKNQGQILSIDLPTPMKESYTLTYQTEYIGHEKWEDHITNKASFEAEGLEAHKNEGSDHFDYSVSEAMGSTHGENGKLKIKKVGDHGEVLSGVTFQLLNSQGIIVAENTTDSNGEIQFKGRRYGEYLLKEVKTKDQYEISQELANGIKELIVDSNGSEIKALVLENERVKFDIPVEKIWEDNQNSAKLRPGSIEITLMRQAGNSKVETVKTVSLNEQSGWHHLFKDQPKYTSDDPTNRQEYTYSVKEKKVAHYRSEVMPSEDHLSFKIKNTYQSSPLILNAKKELTGKKLVADAYSFELKDATGQVLDTASNDATGKIVFKELTYDKVGTYAYTITEKAGSEPGMTYDSHVLKVNVNVTDEGGKLVATATYDGDVTFNNRYKASPGSLVLNAKKELTGKKLVADAYSFELKDATGQVLDTASNDGTGKIVFKELTYDKVGTYAYTITEKAGSEPGMTYDSHVLKVNVTVIDKGGKLVATASYDGATTFENKFEKQVTVNSTTSSASRPAKALKTPKNGLHRLPKTGDKQNPLLIMSGILIIVVIISYLYLKKKNKNNE